MFGSDVLEIGIGMALLFLFASLVASAAQEGIEGLLKHRATDLERGIGELLRSEAATAALYRHPFIYSLYSGGYEDAKKGGSLPSYIPKANFTNAVLDLVAKGGFAAAAAEATATAQVSAARKATPTAEEEVEPRTANASSGGSKVSGSAPGAVMPATAKPPDQATVVATEAEDDCEKAGEAIRLEREKLTASSVAAPGSSPAEIAKVLDMLRLAELRATAGKIEPPELRTAVIALLDDAGGDLARLRFHIEGWYDGTMDRVSGWFKRRTQLHLFAIGLAVAIGLNIDAITVAQRLSRDKTLRDSVVTYSERNLPALAARAAPALPATQPTPVPVPPIAAREADDAATQPGSSVPGQPAQAPIAPAGGPSAGDRGAVIQALDTELKAIGYPLGWKVAWVTGRTEKGEPYDRWIPRHLLPDPQSRRTDATGREVEPAMTLGALLQTILGWLITALAIMLGAPFWFDVLNKFMVIRSTVKPAEKSGDEGSEDRPRSHQQVLRIETKAAG